MSKINKNLFLHKHKILQPLITIADTKSAPDFNMKGVFSHESRAFSDCIGS